jgi:hypothetical protein
VELGGFRSDDHQICEKVALSGYPPNISMSFFVHQFALFLVIWIYCFVDCDLFGIRRAERETFT